MTKSPLAPLQQLHACLREQPREIATLRVTRRSVEVNVVLRQHAIPDLWSTRVLIDRCQRLAGQYHDTAPTTLLAELSEVVADLPLSVNQREHLIVSWVLNRLLARIVRVAGVEDRPDIAKSFAKLVAHSDADRWRTEWWHVAEQCAIVLSATAPRVLPITDARVVEMLHCIERRYRESMLSLRDVAPAVNLSPGHAARLLKQQTGLGFVTHLHRQRIAAARLLLADPQFSMKEVSAAVGYMHPSQFSRHFRLASGITPLAFRASLPQPA